MSQIKEIHLRRATAADAQAIAEVRVEAWRTTYRGMIPDAYLDNMRVADSAEQWQTILMALADQDANADLKPTAKVCVFVAESEGRVIGFVSGAMLAVPKCGMRAELTAVYLLPAWQRCGIGRRMVQKLVRTLQALGASDLLVWVLAENYSARHFYERLSGVKLTEQAFNWDHLDLMEVGYGWKDLSVLLASVDAHSQSHAVH